MVSNSWSDFSKQLTLKELENHKIQDIDFVYISRFRYLTEDIMLKYVEHLVFEHIVCRQPISEKVLTAAVDEKLRRGEKGKIIQRFINQIVAYQDISQNFINKYLKHIDAEELTTKVSMYHKSFVDVMAYLDLQKEIKGNIRATESSLYKTLFCASGEFLAADKLPVNKLTVHFDVFELYESFEYDNRLKLATNRVHEKEKKLLLCFGKEVDDEKNIDTIKRLRAIGCIA